MKIKLKDYSTKQIIIQETENNDNFVESPIKITETDLKNLEIIANKPIEDLDEKSLYLIGDEGLEEQGEKYKNSHIIDIFTVDNLYKIQTHNLMGFIGIKDTQLHITSRFATKNDYFLYYMLEKITNYNIFDFKTSIESNDILNFLPLLFPQYFLKAMQKGLYKEYIKKEYNNSNPKGVLDIQRHIRLNPVFNCKIAYKTKEHSYNNKITQLIRHTIEFIKEHSLNKILENEELRDPIMQIYSATPNYNRLQRENVIKDNYKNLKHSYYVEYEELRLLCLRILNQENIVFNENNDDMYGLLFNASWLWENYLYFVLKENFTDNTNVKHHNTYNLFKDKDKNENIQPDFVIKENDKIITVADAKYKFIENKGNNDIYQIITYMLYSGAKNGALLYPYSGDNNKDMSKEFNINNFENFKKIGLKIDNNNDNYTEFKENMKNNEAEFCKKI